MFLVHVFLVIAMTLKTIIRNSHEILNRTNYSHALAERNITHLKSKKHRLPLLLER